MPFYRSTIFPSELKKIRGHGAHEQSSAKHRSFDSKEQAVITQYLKENSKHVFTKIDISLKQSSFYN